MLYNEQEREIMATAIQPGMRTANVSVKPFQSIVAEQLSAVHFKGARVIDIGPGQCDFLDIAKAKGAETHGIDFDPAISKLGQVRGHRVIQADLRSGWPMKGEVFDGIFCRGSLNCFWFSSTLPTLEILLEDLMGSLISGGWVWIAPWNKPSDEESPSVIEAVRNAVGSWARVHGVEILWPDEDTQRRYGVGYKIPEVEIWRRT